MRSPFLPLTAALVMAGAASLTAQIVLVEPGHLAIKHVDSVTPSHPSQPMLDTTQPIGDIESIAIDPVTLDLYVQLIVPGMAAPSTSTHVFRVAGGVVTPVAINTGLGINERGTDMHFDTVTGLLVTMDDPGAPPGRIATINPGSGVVGTYAGVSTPIFSGGTFGMDFSRGIPVGAAVPGGDIVFTSDVVAAGIHSVTAGAAGSTTHVPGASLPGGGPGDDVVVQPGGDWVWVGEATNAITRISPVAPHVLTPSAFNMQTLATSAGLPFTAGTRAAVCDVSGDVYVTYSALTGGAGLWRLDSQLTTATLVLTVGTAVNFGAGIQDLVVGPSTTGVGNSVYFTVHDSLTGGEEVWEVTATACCPIVASTTTVPDPNGLNAPASIGPWPPLNRPVIGNFGFGMIVDTLPGACPITPGSATYLLVGFAPGGLVWPSFGCVPGTPGDFQVNLGIPPVPLGPVPWPGPGIGAVHSLPIPLNWSLCGAQAFVQGVWLDFTGPSAPAILTWRLDLTFGS